MKTMKRVLSLVLASAMVLTTVGCGVKGFGKGGNSTESNGGKEVLLKYWNAGNGDAWLKDLIQAFNAKQSDWNVVLEASASQEGVKVAFGKEDIDEADIYNGPNGSGDIQYLETLDDLLECTADGDSKTIGEKYNQAYLDIERASDGHYYGLNVKLGSPGIVYNTKLFAKAGIDTIPRTTNELVIACEKMLDAGVTPWIHFKSGGYNDRLTTLWWAQYDGYDYYRNNFTQLQVDGLTSKEVIMKKDGRFKALEALEKLITKETVLAGSNSYDHITSQTMFLNQDIGMMTNGTWLSNEMEDNLDDYRMMKTPVISSITEKLETVKKDTDLRKLITAIDAVTEGTAKEEDYKQGSQYVVEGITVSETDWKYVKSARNMAYSDSTSVNFYIPKYAAEKEGAKEFLKFVLSDEGIKITQKYLHNKSALSLCEGEVDTSNWNEFEKSALKVADSAEHLVIPVGNKAAHPVFSQYMTDAFAVVQYVAKFCAANDEDKQTAEEVWASIEQKFEDLWKQWMVTLDIQE